MNYLFFAYLFTFTVLLLILIKSLRDYHKIRFAAVHKNETQLIKDAQKDKK